MNFTFYMNASEAEAYKLEKEAFVSGFNGSSIEDVFLVCFMIPVKIYNFFLVIF